mmetsp:Transcript_55692/g.155219  ORF Transcript_55692/g.155219 Transcript_55692/m.155219 type:complete len:214 (-) Transcript_55692:122-763(-)
MLHGGVHPLRTLRCEVSADGINRVCPWAAWAQHRGSGSGVRLLQRLHALERSQVQWREPRARGPGQASSTAGQTLWHWARGAQLKSQRSLHRVLLPAGAARGATSRGRRHATCPDRTIVVATGNACGSPGACADGDPRCQRRQRIATLHVCSDASDPPGARPCAQRRQIVRRDARRESLELRRPPQGRQLLGPWPPKRKSVGASRRPHRDGKN